MKKFNLRVYGLIQNKQDQILISHENRFSRSFSKFPGGGIEWGEGTVEALKRELLEEIGIDFQIGELFYVNDFFQQSAFRETDQIFSFYYHVKCDDYSKVLSTPNGEKNDGEVFKWHDLSEIEDTDLTFPIDKIVLNKYKEA